MTYSEFLDRISFYINPVILEEAHIFRGSMGNVNGSKEPFVVARQGPTYYPNTSDDKASSYRRILVALTAYAKEEKQVTDIADKMELGIGEDAFMVSRDLDFLSNGELYTARIECDVWVTR